MKFQLLSYINVSKTLPINTYNFKNLYLNIVIIGISDCINNITNI